MKICNSYRFTDIAIQKELIIDIDRVMILIVVIDIFYRYYNPQELEALLRWFIRRNNL